LAAIFRRLTAVASADMAVACTRRIVALSNSIVELPDQEAAAASTHTVTLRGEPRFPGPAAGTPASSHLGRADASLYRPERGGWNRVAIDEGDGSGSVWCGLLHGRGRRARQASRTCRGVSRSPWSAGALFQASVPRRIARRAARSRTNRPVAPPRKRPQGDPNDPSTRGHPWSVGRRSHPPRW
jgi:hypothetical protein